MSARWLKPRHDSAFSSGPCGMPQNVASYCASAACRAANAPAVFARLGQNRGPLQNVAVPRRHGSHQAQESAQHHDPQAAQQPCNFMFHNR